MRRDRRKVSDDALLAEIEAAFTERGLWYDCELEAEVEDGVVELSGTVPTQERKRAVLSALKSVRGMRGVDVDLYVVEEGVPFQVEDIQLESEESSQAEVDQIMREKPELPEGEVSDLEG